MGRVKGVKEKLHMPIYDAFFVDPAAPVPRNTFQGAMTDPRMIRFFVDVQNKTKLETNLQAAGVLPSSNTFEARALRVVISPPTLPARPRPPLLPASTPANVLADLIYSSVTTLLVGEKIMFEAPSYLVPGGAGISGGDGNVSNHGEADPMATFRFAEPVIIEPQQNFRVEMLFPHGVPGQAAPPALPNPNQLAGIPGPFRVWAVLDGYLTRDVQ